jgi:hypothetical protein
MFLPRTCPLADHVAENGIAPETLLWIHQSLPEMDLITLRLMALLLLLDNARLRQPHPLTQRKPA